MRETKTGKDVKREWRGKGHEDGKNEALFTMNVSDLDIYGPLTV